MMMQKKILSGVQPTRQLTIGNYFGALINWQKTQYEGESLFCVVDLHAITQYQNPQDLYQNSLKVAALYLACGIDPVHSKIFIQSHVRQHTELSWLLGCSTPLGWLNRMTQFKDKAGQNTDKVGLGLYAYPVLMAADILLYHTTHVPVGADQKQHIELTRDMAISFNHTYGQPVFTIPEPVITAEGAKIMSLRDGTKKMSKSDPSDLSRILLTDTPDDIVQKIKKAKTDTQPLPDSIDELIVRPEAKNLVQLFALATKQSMQQVLHQYAGQNFSVFKPLLADVLVNVIEPIQVSYNTFMTDPMQLNIYLKQGADHAAAIAETTVKHVKQVMGFYS